MKNYKIVNPEGHNGLIYHEGINTDPQKFNPSGDCEGGGIYFAREDILAFLGFGTDLYEVEPVGEQVYENPSKDNKSKKWKAHQLNMKYIGKVIDNIQFLVEQGADIHACDDLALRWAAMNGHLELVKYLVEQGANVNIEGDSVLYNAAQNGHLDVVKYLVENGANVHADGDEALRWAFIS